MYRTWSKGGELGNSVAPAIEILFEGARVVWPFRVVVCPELHGCRPRRLRVSNLYLLSDLMGLRILRCRV